MPDIEKPQNTQMSADRNPDMKNICVDLRYLRFVPDGMIHG